MDTVLALPRAVARRLEGRPHLRKIAENTSWFFVERILRMVVGLFVGSWVARYLGPEQFGAYSYVLSFVALFGAIATLGLDSLVIRDILNDPSRGNEILGTAFFLKLGGGLLMFVSALGTMVFLDAGDATTLWLVGIVAGGSIFQAFDVIGFLFRSQVQVQYALYGKIVALSVIAIVKVLLISVHAPLYAFALAGAAEIMLGAVGLCIAYRVNGHSIQSWRWSPACARGLLHDSWPLIFSGLTIMVYMRIDQVMLRDMVGPRALGVYAVAVQLAEVWYVIPMAIVSSVLPSIIEAKARSEALFYARLQKLYRLVALLGYLVAIPTTFVAGNVVTLLYGDAFSAAGPMLALLVWAGIFTNLGVARSSFLTTMNWTQVYLLTTLAGGVINVGLNLILIPKYHGMGAVIASLAAYSFQAYFSCFFCNDLRKTGMMLSKALVFPILLPKNWTD